VTDEELNGHIEIVEQCRDYLDHEAMDNGDPSGKLRDFVESLRAMLARVQRLEALEVAAREWRAGMVEVAPGRHIDSDDGNSEPPRCFRSGITTFGNAVGKRGFAGYRGRDWKQRLADDAVAWLRNLENTP
jgi:hypothetical protein